jgi:1-deoxyxylulose-5-phosphate synthase
VSLLVDQQPMTAAKCRIGLGCVTFGREIDETASFALLDYASERGVMHYDTASAYGGGASESIVGRWLKSRKPAGITVATKILPPYDRIDLSSSLSRLGVEQIDLLYLHQWHQTAPLASQALRDALQNGQVKALGVSNFSLEQLVQMDAPITAVQNNHNLAVSDVTDELRAHCAAYGIAIITYSPLGAGFLTGKHRDVVQADSRFDMVPAHQQVYFHDHAYRRLAKLEAAAVQSGVPQAHLALAWALHQPGIDTVLVGGRHPAHLDQAFAALEYDDLELLGQLNEV